MFKRNRGLLICVALMGCSAPEAPAESHRAVAEGFFRGVFGCDPALIDAFGAEDVVVSYPIFESLYQTSALRGREATKEFSANFCRKWGDPEITVDRVVEQGAGVVLLWSFSAADKAAPDPPDGEPRRRQTWGGISAFRIDDQGKVVEEVGEESAPGPAARIRRSSQ